VVFFASDALAGEFFLDKKNETFILQQPYVTVEFAATIDLFMNGIF